MSYLNTNSRTVKTPGNEKFQPMGRTSTLFGVFMGTVKRVDDIQRMGRLQVHIPEFGSAPEEEAGWITVSYSSPFAGATNVQTTSTTDLQSFEKTQTSYGMWMVPPDVGNHVLIMFVNGDAARGIWFGVLYDQFMNNMVPGMAASASNYQYPGKVIPVAEYNKWDTKVTQPDRAIKPYEATKFKGLGNQGLITDPNRGVTDSSARRESPSQVFGIITPGPVIDKNATPDNIRRKGGSSFIMDDAEGSEYVQLTTKSGAQININETNGFIYLINRDGTAWVQMDAKGNIDIFGATNISMRAQRDVNIRADRNINFEAGQNIFMKAAQDTVEGTTTFTYDVNNVPKPTTIPVWNYVGEGKGNGGNIVMQSLNNLHSTSRKGAFLSVIENNMNISVGNSLSVTTLNGGQNYNSKQGIKLTTDAALDIATTGNIRIGAKGSVNVVGISNVSVCTDSSISLNSQGSIIAAAVGKLSFDATSVDIGTDVNVSGLTSSTTMKSTTVVYDSQAIGGGSPTPATTLNTISTEGALSATTARPAEVKPLNDKIDILATWADPESKFKRNAKSLQTTVSRFPTYEPCPEHDKFKRSSVSGATPVITPDDKTYKGSSGAGNNATVPPAAAVNVGANNTSIKGDPTSNSDVTKDVNVNALRCQLIIHEGLATKSYLDTMHLLHGGIGHLMRTNEIPLYPVGTPISGSQIDTWYTQDSSSAIKIAQELLGNVWGDLSDIRKRAMIDLSFNMGKARLGQFVNFLSAMRRQDFNTAGKELRDSVWFSQVGKRGPNVVMMIVQDVDPSRCDKKFPE